jgi:endonuclease YncB( thermonuclease family)
MAGIRFGGHTERSVGGAWAVDNEGSAVVLDGDTIEIHVGDKIIPVRLCEIDNPETPHAGGPEASAKMA